MECIALLVIAKEPRPGRAKTRLSPPCTLAQAATLAAASLRDTIDVVARTPAHRKVLVFEGDPRPWWRSGFEVLPQRGIGLDERLAHAFEDVASPALLVGMDTPQLTPRLLLDGMEALARPENDAVLGPALDGGYWSVGLKRARAEVFRGVPMSRRSTWSEQNGRLWGLGLRVHAQPALRDIDTIEDAYEVARQAPRTRFAAALASIGAVAP